ncbi:DUF4442 domain-containing protein [Saliniradius amylolyticus]
MKLLFNLYPPYWGTGISVSFISDDYQSIQVKMPLRFYNRNLVGSHFGGNLMSMTDPFLMVMLMKNLGRKYIVWDVETHINFISPGKGTVYADFRLTESWLESIKNQISNKGESIRPKFEIPIYNSQGKTIASVKKTLYIKNTKG